MKILAIETSCDETGASVVSKNPNENYVKILSNVVASSMTLHSKTGGVIPNVAAREQLKYIVPVIEEAIKNSKLKIENLDAIAVTLGPGLIGSLLIGVETAKTLSYLWNKPLIPVNHLLGHIYANWLITKNQKPWVIDFPALVLLVSGGHTDLVLINNHNNLKWLGGTRDDAAGEAFDKIGRLLNLPYPAGPVMEAIAKKGNEKAFNFPRPMIGSKDFDFSFSGLKAAVMRKVIATRNMDEKTTVDIAACVQRSIVQVLLRKTITAAKKYDVRSILLSGGVAANQRLRNELSIESSKLNIEFFVPAKSLCTDNAAMIGAYAAFHPKKETWSKIMANPELYFRK
jgi:N6-L-threonylcarbamoyladenine synthase